MGNHFPAAQPGSAFAVADCRLGRKGSEVVATSFVARQKPASFPDDYRLRGRIAATFVAAGKCASHPIFPHPAGNLLPGGSGRRIGR